MKKKGEYKTTGGKEGGKECDSFMRVSCTWKSREKSDEQEERIKESESNAWLTGAPTWPLRSQRGVLRK